MTKYKTMFDEWYDEMLEITTHCSYCSETIYKEDGDTCIECLMDKEKRKS